MKKMHMTITAFFVINFMRIAFFIDKSKYEFDVTGLSFSTGALVNGFEKKVES